jgi:hypothetical protein
VGYLEAVHGQAAARLLVAILEVADYGVVHVLLLLTQKVRRHCVQAVAGQLVVPLQDSMHCVKGPGKWHRSVADWQATIHCGMADTAFML